MSIITQDFNVRNIPHAAAWDDLTNERLAELARGIGVGALEAEGRFTSRLARFEAVEAFEQASFMKIRVYIPGGDFMLSVRGDMSLSAQLPDNWLAIRVADTGLVVTRRRVE